MQCKAEHKGRQFVKGNAKLCPKNTVARIMFVTAPASEIFSIPLLSVDPPIIIAPGEIILIGKNTQASVIMAPKWLI